jgi:L,D-peptidoglycan transpeptidase YkuD (ErfK/YbiS/YcfS/YnhG family)
MLTRFSILLMALITLFGCERDPVYLSEKWGCKQLLVVKTAGLDSLQGQLATYDWSDEKQAWLLASEAVPMVVGYKGLAWGEGLQEEYFNQKPYKKEGDKRSPAGIFYVSSLFGYGNAADLGALKMPYLQADSTVFCVDDTHSKFYNRIVDVDSVSKDWQSAEPMLMDSEYYKYGAVIDYNYPKTDTGKGSCIFLHVWFNAHSGTYGCTAIDINYMKHILLWLDKSKNPILIQAPEKDYEAFKKKYFLP